jgi:predicted nucleotide-binding protein (sugar kinase/HSP70/actin superfamily)
MMSGKNSNPTPGKVIVPAMAHGGARLLAAAFRAVGIEAEITPPSDARTLELGSRYTCGDECFPAKVTIGDFMKILENPNTEPSRTIFFLPSADGPCRFGQYAPYLRRVLDAAGYGGVRILSPNCDDGYASLGRVAAPFFRTAWRAAVAADLIEKLMLTIRPYEVKQGEADQAYQESIETLSDVLENAPISPGPQLRALCDALGGCRNRFRRLDKRRESRPLIGIVGEIFCRLNSFSNQNVIRRLEAYGAEAWIAGFAEWVWYANAEEMRLLTMRGRRLSCRAFRARLRNHFQRCDEQALREPLAADLAERPEPEIAEVLNAARPYLPAQGASGEMVLNVGNVPCFARRDVDGVIDISPFTCMNGIVSEAIYPRISKDLGGLPIRSLYFDGAAADQDLDLELGVFVEMARAHRHHVDNACVPLAG